MGQSEILQSAGHETLALHQRTHALTALVLTLLGHQRSSKSSTSCPEREELKLPARTDPAVFEFPRSVDASEMMFLLVINFSPCKWNILSGIVILDIGHGAVAAWFMKGEPDLSMLKEEAFSKAVYV